MIYTTAVCESCAKPQPKDWQAGQLCIHCGQAVRREVRCFWCVTWTPDAKYCRKCGADVIDPELFGVARMLKDAGTDRFTIPKLIGEFDEGRIATFRSLYLAQAAIVEAHTADLRTVEAHLLQRHWSDELEQELVAQLPWPDRQIPHHRRSSTLLKLAETTPFAITRTLAQIARLRSGDSAARDEASNALHDSDPRIQEEAALAVTHWRVAASCGVPRGYDSALESILKSSRFRDQADVRLAYVFSRRYPLRRELLGSSDAEVAFQASLIAGDEDVLAAAANDLHRDELTRYAACNRLAFDGPLGTAIGNSLPTLDPKHQVDVLETIARRKTGAPGLARVLLQLAHDTDEPRVRQRAILVLCRDMSYETAMEVIPYGVKDTDIAADLFRSQMPPEAMAVFGERLVDAGLFGVSHWGMEAAAKPGRMPDTFVPAVYSGALDERTRRELIRFAEMQVGARDMDCPLLVNFLIERCFAEAPGEAQSDAWASMSRIQHRGSPSAVVPFEMASPVIQEVFGSMDRFLGLFAALLQQQEWRDDVSIVDHISKFLRYTDDGVHAAICASREADHYIEAVVSLLEDANLRGFTRHNAIYPLIGIGEGCPARKSQMTGILERLQRDFPDLTSELDYALRRLRGELG
jgi:hypothetical protein